jgi:TolB-like protein/Flp pilus assembly protein TadD
MYTDLVGYTALGQRNESLSLALVEQQRSMIRPILAKQGGREVKTMGDAFLVEFPNALDAVNCAFEIQRATREHNESLPDEKRVHLRVGIHLGDVVESQGDILGDAVNVASRIVPLAEDGGVCLTRQVYDQVANKFELPLKSLGPKSLKNVSTPMEIFKMGMPWDEEGVTRPAKLDKGRIAVLPFASMSPDPADEYFADGLTEELISKLSLVKDLRVIARTSVMSYKNREKRVSEIGSELGVGSIVEGSVRKAGSKIRVTAQLIDVGTEEHLWASSYDKNLDDIFAVQSDIASSVASSLRVRLLSGESARIGAKETDNVAAYVAYLKGRGLLREGTEKAAHLAREQFELAIKEDESYAKAYAGMADSVMILGDYLFAPIPVALEEANAFVKKALALDPNLAEARVSLANLLMYDYKFGEAENEFRRAIDTNPSYATGHHWYSTCLLTLGRQNEALEQILLAEELDPLSPAITISAVYRLIGFAAADEIEKRIRKLEEIDPKSPLSEEARMITSFARKDWDAATTHLNKMIELDPSDPYLDADLAYIYAVTGRRQDALRLAEKLKGVPEDAKIKGQLLAFVHLGLGDLDSTFEWLNFAVSKKEIFLNWVRAYPFFEPVRSDPRFKDLLKAAGVPPESR